MAEPSQSLLSRSAPGAAAQLGLGMLDEVGAAAARLDDPDDTESLHDFRVALRRLRTLLRGFRAELADAVSKKPQRRLRDLARRTSAGRDAEVELAWVRTRRAELARGSRGGLRWLVARLAARRDRAYTAVHDELAPEFRHIARRLRRALLEVSEDASLQAAPFALAAARVLRSHATTLGENLAAVRSARDVDAIHGSRIAVKRSRYLLEWLASDVPQAATLVARLRELQDLLGELRDVQVLIAELGDAVADAAAERARALHARALGSKIASPRAGHRARGPAPGSAGLLALARLAAETEGRLVRQVTIEWADTAGRALVHDIVALADSLAAPPPPTVARARPARALRVRRTRQAPL